MIKLNTIQKMEALEGLKQIEDKSINCIWIDPPYNINYKYDEYKDTRIDYFDWCLRWLKESYRVLKDDGSIFVKMWSRHLFKFNHCLEKAGFHFKNLIVWKRKSCATYSDKYLGGYEVIFFFYKTENNTFFPEGFLRDTQFLKRWDGTKTYKGRLNDLWDDIKPVTAGNLKHPEGIYVEGTGKKEHPAQHPEELVERSILCTTEKGDVVLDFFCGSGTTCAVCKRLNRQFIGFDISEKYVSVSNQRVEEISAPKVITQNSTSFGFPTENSLNKDLTATQQVASPKSASQTSLNPNIHRRCPNFEIGSLVG